VRDSQVDAIIRINSTLSRLFFTSGKMHPHWEVGNTVQWVWSLDASGTIVTIFSKAVLETLQNCSVTRSALLDPFLYHAKAKSLSLELRSMLYIYLMPRSDRHDLTPDRCC
jgi:hypothetical protein